MKRIVVKENNKFVEINTATGEVKVLKPEPKQEIPQDIEDRLSEAERLINEAFKLARAYTTINVLNDDDAENVVVKVYGLVGRIRDNAFKATR